jgi:hypothetical protein
MVPKNLRLFKRPLMKPRLKRKNPLNQSLFKKLQLSHLLNKKRPKLRRCPLMKQMFRRRNLQSL